MRTEPLVDHLTVEKERAIIALAGGATLGGAAKAAGVSRTALAHWLDNDIAFVAAYTAERQAIRQSVAVTLENAAVAAVASLRAICEGSAFEENRIEAGRVLLQTLTTATSSRSPVLRAADAEAERRTALAIPARMVLTPEKAEIAAKLIRECLAPEGQNGDGNGRMNGHAD